MKYIMVLFSFTFISLSSLLHADTFFIAVGSCPPWKHGNDGHVDWIVCRFSVDVFWMCYCFVIDVLLGFLLFLFCCFVGCYFLDLFLICCWSVLDVSLFILLICCWLFVGLLLSCCWNCLILYCLFVDFLMSVFCFFVDFILMFCWWFCWFLLIYCRFWFRLY